jgi:predicted amidohydrolase YtcJ
MAAWPRRRARALIALLLAAAGSAVAAAEAPADLVVVNARVATLDAASTLAEAIAVRDGRIVAVGGSASLRALAGPKTRLVDAGGRSVVPGLIDSHIHAIRAALSFATEVSWIDAASIAEATARLRARAHAAPPGSWLIVAGGWAEQQFAEKRRPTLREIEAAVPDHPVYIQLFYSAVLMTPKARDALGLAPETAPPRMSVERDSDGKATGWLLGDIGSISLLFDRLPRPGFDDNVAGTRAFFAELNRLAVTGVIDPGGFNLAPAQYAALLKLWREQALTVRVAYSAFAQTAATELADFRALTQLLPMGFGDEWLRFNGIGENVAWGVYNNDNPSEASREQFYQICKWAASQRMSLNIHWHNDSSVGIVLDIFERVNQEHSIKDLRWTLVHLEDASEATLKRMKNLGVGWALQDAGYFEGEQQLKEKGAEAMKSIPRMNSALKIGVHVGAGTDAHRVMSYNPWVALRWMLDGKTVGGQSWRGPEETPTRVNALRMYTQGSAWFAFAEKERGSLEVGKLADLAVLSKDYFKVPVEEIRETEAVMTMVGGRIVHSFGQAGREFEF